MATLQLGCGVRPLAGAINHDRIKHADHVDVGHDLEVLPWPWSDGEFDKVIAIDVLEHLRPWHCEMKTWLDELWRILKPNGQAVLHLPAWDQELSYRDPTHYKVFHPESFHYWWPGNYLHEQFGKFYFAESNRWWNVLGAQYDFPEQPPGKRGDIGYVLQKIAR
jgi:cyclopropane fatty-acyl-phospholipid synthase-like methyltransferase